MNIDLFGNEIIKDELLRDKFIEPPFSILDTKCGMEYYNEAILLNAIASASMRANRNMKSNKLVKVHQNILIFKKI